MTTDVLNSISAKKAKNRLGAYKNNTEKYLQVSCAVVYLLQHKKFAEDKSISKYGDNENED